MSYKFTAVAPADELKSFVRTFFTIEFNDDDTGQDYLLPNGLPSVFYSCGDKPVKAYFGESKSPALMLNGFYVGYCNTIISLTHGKAKIAGATVYPVYFNMICGKKLSDIMNQFCELEEPELLMPVKHLMNSPASASKVFECFEKYMTHQLMNHPLHDDFSKVYRTLTSAGGYQLQVEDLAASLDCSTRHLNSRFRQNLGMSPKQFIKLVKFNYALKRIYDSNGEENLSSIAHDVGYHDQSHFIRDFKSICGRTPKEIAGDTGSLAARFRLF